MLSRHAPAKAFCYRQGECRAFTLVELLATIAIVAMLTAGAIVYIGNYVAYARQTADKQTLTILNDALTRYKTEGGGTTGLTVGASVGNVLRRLGQTVSWSGLSHQFLKTGATYPARSLSAYGNGAQYKFARYGSYADPTTTGGAITTALAGVGGVGDVAAFNNWLADAFAVTGSTNYLALTNPATTDRFGLYARVASSGKKVRVWWGDGTTSNYDSMTTGGNTAIAKVYSSAAARGIVIVGDLSYINSTNADDGLGGAGASNFGGDIGTMRTLTNISLGGSDTVSGSVANLTNLAFLALTSPGNTIGGDLTGKTELVTLHIFNSGILTGDISSCTKMQYCAACADNTLTGDISGFTSLGLISVGGHNTLSGTIAALNSISYIDLGGSNTVTGNLSSIGSPTVYYVNIWGLNTVSYNTTSGSKSWAGDIRRIYLRPNTAGVFTSAMVDALIIDLASVSTWNNDKLIDLRGNCGARTSASDAAVATLTGNGVTVVTN